MQFIAAKEKNKINNKDVYEALNTGCERGPSTVYIYELSMLHNIVTLAGGLMSAWHDQDRDCAPYWRKRS